MSDWMIEQIALDLQKKIDAFQPSVEVRDIGTAKITSTVGRHGPMGHQSNNRVR